MLHFELVTPAKLVRSEDVYMVVVPGTEGEFGVLEGHAPVMSTIRDGAMKVYKTELIRQQGPGGRSSRSSLRPSNTCGGGTMSVSTVNSIFVLRSRSNRRTTLKPRRFCHRPADRETGRNKNQANSGHPGR